MRDNIYQIYRRYRKFYCPFLVAIIWLITGIYIENFWNLFNVFIILRQSVYVGILALAMAIIVITGSIDFSIVAVSSLASSFCILFLRLHWPIWIAILLSLTAASLCGLLNGLLLTYTTIMPYYLTVGTMVLFLGISSEVRGIFQLEVLPESFSVIGKGYFGMFPISVLMMFLVYLLVSLILNQTYFGRYLFALGNNPSGLAFIGVNTRYYKIMAFVMTSFLAGLAGIIFTSRNNYVNTSENFSYIVDTIVALTLGGIHLQRSTVKVSGIFWGSLVICSISKCFSILNTGDSVQNIVLGLLFIVTIIVDHYIEWRMNHLNVVS